MTKFFLLLATICLLASCRSTKKIQTAIAKKDSIIRVNIPLEKRKNDTGQLIKNTLQQFRSHLISYQTFSAKVNVDYTGSNGKKYNVNTNIRMYKDSAIWVNVNAILGIDVMRLLITKDSVKLIDKLNKTYKARSVDYLKDVTALPLDLSALQNLIIGNAVFLDSSNIVSYSTGNGLISLFSIGHFFKNLLTLNAEDKTLLHSKLDDADIVRNRTADLTYNNYENKKGFPFSTKRRIVVTEKNRLDIKLDFKQYDFNQNVSFPFSIPKNYDRN